MLLLCYINVNPNICCERRFVRLCNGGDGVLGLTWQYVFVSILLDILLPLSCVGGVDLLRPVFGR